MDAHSSSDPRPPPSIIHHPEPQIQLIEPRQVSQQRVAQQYDGSQQKELQNGEMKARQPLPTPPQLLGSPSWTTFGSGSTGPLHQLPGTPSQQYSSCSSHHQRDLGALLFDSIESSVGDSEGTSKGMAVTTNGGGGRKRRGPNMNRHQKFTLAKLCSTYAAEYKAGTRGKFWHKMAYLLKQETGYDHRGVQIVVERWIKIRQTELFEREMGSGTEEKRNSFMEAVDKFTERWQHSHNQAGGISTVKKTQEDETNSFTQAHHNSMMGNVADEGIIEIGGNDTSQERWQQSHNQAAGEVTGEKTQEDESNNFRHVHHNTMMGNAADEGIIQAGGNDTLRGEEQQYSHNQAAGKKTREEESNNFRQARHSIMMANAAGEGVIQVGGNDTLQEEDEDEEENEDTTPAPTTRQARRTAEDSMAESFSRIADYFVSESHEAGRSEEQDGSQRKRRRSPSADDEQWARIEARIDAKLDQFMARISKKLDDFIAIGLS